MNRLNSRGVFLTLMVFLLAISVIAIYQNTSLSTEARQNIGIEELAAQGVNRSFEQVYFDVISLAKTGKEKRVQARGLPFDYNLGSDFVLIRHSIPINLTRLRGFYDFLNSYTIFLNSQKIAERGVHIDLNLARSGVDTAWNDNEGGINPEVDYVIIPQCIVYPLNEGGGNPFDLDTFAIRPGTIADGCAADFDATDHALVTSWHDLNAIRITLFFPADGTVEAVFPNGCRGDLKSGAECKTDPYTPASEPYVEVFAQTSDTPSTLIAAGHFDPYNAVTNRVSVQFTPLSGEAPPVVDVDIAPCASDGPDCRTLSIVEYHNLNMPSPVTTSTLLQFRTNIDEFFLWGVDMNVYKEGFDLLRYSGSGSG